MRGHVSSELPVDAPAADVWAVYTSCTEFRNILLGMMHNYFKEIEIIEGGGGEVGSVYRLVITSGLGLASEPSTVKNKVTKIDHDNRRMVLQQIEGGFLDLGFNLYEDIFKVIEISDNLSIIRSTVVFEIDDKFEATAALVNCMFTQQIARVVAKYVLEQNAEEYDT
ncbi:hypothetical protein GIB67_001979 [Kingdonia uniflora]|uniref:Bet v I/Major latex protein domain-containing protein n=1 Tax=Kingdonia uniflora TaxID=39325 RepID=A0A7J7M9Y1_9MAGN|nr:hypothetical protein GIB67_001979 [Kingdonia uniflora]